MDSQTPDAADAFTIDVADEKSPVGADGGKIVEKEASDQQHQQPSKEPGRPADTNEIPQLPLLSEEDNPQKASISNSNSHTKESNKIKKSSSPLFLDEEKIKTAEKFLRYSEIHDVPTSAKRKYLEEKAGMSKDEIDIALERAARMVESVKSVESDTHDTHWRRGGRYRNRTRGGEDAKDVQDVQDWKDVEEDVGGRGGRVNPRRRGGGRTNRGYEYDGEYGEDLDREGVRHRRPRRYRNDPDFYEYDENPRRDRPPARRPPTMEDIPPQEYSQPSRYSNNNVSPVGAYREDPAIPRQREMAQLEPSSSSFSLAAWAGGFSVGVFCLAAFRWLNGGDFVLFPPPTVGDVAMAQQHRDNKRGERAQLENVEQGRVPDEDVNEEIEEGALSPLEEEHSAQVEAKEQNDNDMSESSDDHQELNMILNGKSNAQHLHSIPQEHLQQPSYEELVLEIRSLTSAIHSYRDMQERATKAATAQAGKVMTDDAMNFLRMDKSTSLVEEKGDGLDAIRTKNIIDATVISNIQLLLTGLVSDLSLVKKSVAKVNEESQCDKDAAVVDKETDLDEKEGSLNDPSQKIDGALDKINQILEILQKPENEDDSPNRQDKIVKESLPTSAEVQLPAANEAENASKNTADLTASGEPDESESEPNNGSLEEALKTLANNNNAEELKIGAQMLYLYCLNISKNPTIPRFRKIYTNNDNFRKKVGNMKGSKEFLLAVGFVERTNCFEWAQPDDGTFDAKSKLDFALATLEILRNGTKPDHVDTASGTGSPPKVDSSKPSDDAKFLVSDHVEKSLELK